MGKPFEPNLSVDELINSFAGINSINIIKSGGEGTVFSAINRLGKKVAIKVYSPNHKVARNQLEVEKLLKLNNPYITKLYSYGNILIRNEQCYYTETEFIDGSDLRQLLNKGYRFTADDVCKMILCISSCIKDLWKQHVVHCDIKPDNIIKSGDNYTLIDLGVAKHLDATTITVCGTILGTLGYLAPEQFTGRKNITYKADYYALGITAYEILTGRHPFNNNQEEMLKPFAAITFPDSIKIPKGLQNVLTQLTQYLAYKRPINYDEIYKLLETNRR